MFSFENLLRKYIKVDRNHQQTKTIVVLPLQQFLVIIIALSFS